MRQLYIMFVAKVTLVHADAFGQRLLDLRHAGRWRRNVCDGTARRILEEFLEICSVSLKSIAQHCR